MTARVSESYAGARFLNGGISPKSAACGKTQDLQRRALTRFEEDAAADPRMGESLHNIVDFELAVRVERQAHLPNGLAALFA
jgi:hypothetical protein